MRKDTPLPNSPMSGLVSYENGTSIRPGDEIEVRESDENDEEKHYCVMRVDDGESVLLYEYGSRAMTTFTKENLKGRLIEPDYTYQRHILNRDTAPLNDKTNESVALYGYAVENPVLQQMAGGTKRALLFGWAFTPQQPVENMPDLDGSLPAPNFHDLLDSVHPETGDEDVVDAYEYTDTPLPEMFAVFIKGCDFNARKMFEINGEPTYDENLERRFEREAESIGDAIEHASNVFV